MNVLKAIVKELVKAFAIVFLFGFVYGAIQSIVEHFAAPKGITPRQFARMKRNIRKYTTDYTSHLN